MPIRHINSNLVGPLAKERLHYLQELCRSDDYYLLSDECENHLQPSSRSAAHDRLGEITQELYQVSLIMGEINAHYPEMGYEIEYTYERFSRLGEKLSRYMMALDNYAYHSLSWRRY